MPIRHTVRYRPIPRGITSRRLAAAKSALKRERERRPLFADQIAIEQPTPEARIAGFDEELQRQDQGHRDLAAEHWRWGRVQLSMLSDELRREVVEAWNKSTIPPRAEYFADFVRTAIKRQGLPIADDA